MRNFLFGFALTLVSLSASAQIIASDSASVFPDNRTRLVARSGYVLAQTKVGGSVVNKKLWLNGIRTINSAAPDAQGNLVVATGLDQTTADGRYPLLGSTYTNPSFISTLAATKLTGTLGATNMGALTGDVTSTAGSFGTTIGSNVVSNAKLAQLPAFSFKGNNTGASANAADLTVAQSRALLVVDQLDNTSDLNKPISTAQAAVNAVKSSAKRVSLTSAANGAAITHNLNNTIVTVLFRPTGSTQYDFNFSWTVTDANTIALVTPYDASGSRETFTGEVFIETAN